MHAVVQLRRQMACRAATGPDARVEVAETAFGAKYTGGTFMPDGRHGWLKITPTKIVSWDFRKLPR